VSASKPRVFIGSSTEGLKIAEALHVALDYVTEPVLWNDGSTFRLGRSYLESLVEAAPTFDFAALVLTADDMTTKRGAAELAPRDNLLFELGLFMGALGRDRAFFVYSRDQPPALPTDLAGISAAKYAERSDGNLRAAMNSVSLDLRRAMGLS
jgi:predicted nucleotide-binding protein